MVVVFIILLAYIVLEFILFAKGKSIGKAILGMQVVSSTDGKPFRFWKMLFRECFVKSASGSVFGLGYIWVLLDEKNRGWHDKILDSYVVDLKESERINYRRHLEKARVAASQAESVPETVPEQVEPVIEQVEPVIEQVEPVIEPQEAVIEQQETVFETAEPEVEMMPVAEENATMDSIDGQAEETDEKNLEE
jgi:hypothetical protein